MKLLTECSVCGMLNSTVWINWLFQVFVNSLFFIRRLAEEEMQTNILDSERVHLPTAKELRQDQPDLIVSRQRVKDILLVLGNFKERCEPGRKRKEYIRLLNKDLCFLYDYNEFLVQKLFDLFGVNVVEFLEANEQSRPLTIRTNTLKTRRRDLAKVNIVCHHCYCCYLLVFCI